MTEKFDFQNNFDHLDSEQSYMANKGELLKAEAEGHKKGFKEGHNAAHQEIEARANELLEKLSTDIARLVQTQKDQHEMLEEYVLKLTFEAFEKLLPGFVASDKCQTSFQRMGEALSFLDEDSKINIKVSKELYKKSQSHFKDLHVYKYLNITADDHLDMADFKISWEGGNMDYVYRRLEREIVSLLEPNTP